MARGRALAARLRHLARALPLLALWAAAGCELLIDGELVTIRCAREGASGPPDCRVGEVCAGHVCAEPAGAPSELGSRCQDDAGCAAGSFCLDPGGFGTGPFSAGKRRCARPCCGSAECGDPAAGLVCARPDLGGPSYCRRAVDVGRAAPGIGPAASVCAAHEDCRSGLCDLAATPPTCLDSCCSDTSCAATQTACRFGERAAQRGFSCGAPAGALGYGAACGDDAACASGLCLELEGTKRCSTPCCNATQCAPMDGRAVACADVPHAVFVRACALLLPNSAMGEVGTVCAEDLECRSGLCRPPEAGQTHGECTDTCCSDEGCGALGTFRCLPRRTGPPWPLRCERK